MKITKRVMHYTRGANVSMKHIFGAYINVNIRIEPRMRFDTVALGRRWVSEHGACICSILYFNLSHGIAPLTIFISIGLPSSIWQVLKAMLCVNSKIYFVVGKSFPASASLV